MAMSSQVIDRGSKQFQGVFSELWTAKGVWDAASIADGDEVVDTLTVPGVALGNMILGVSASVSVADLVLSAAVTAADTVTVSLANNTGAAVNLASATFRVVVGKPNF